MTGSMIVSVEVEGGEALFSLRDGRRAAAPMTKEGKVRMDFADDMTPGFLPVDELKALTLDPESGRMTLGKRVGAPRWIPGVRQR